LNLVFFKYYLKNEPLHQVPESFARNISVGDKYPTMTPLSRLILDQIALHEALGKLLTVREIYAWFDPKSLPDPVWDPLEATVYGALKA
jgi:hypothetical protein